MNSTCEYVEAIMANKFIKTGETLECANSNCKNKLYVKKSVYAAGINSGRIFCCSVECSKSPDAMQKKQALFLKKFGVSNVFQMNTVKEKISKTNLRKYGVKNPFQSPEIKDKIKKTLIERYGVDHPQRNKEIRLKTIKTLNTRYNLQGFANKIVLEQTNLERYGAKQFFASELGKMTKENFIRRHGEFLGMEKFNEYNKNKAITLEKMTSKWGSDLGTFKYNEWKRKVAGTLDNFILRHGEDEGIDRWKNFILKIHGNTSKCSKISLKLFESINQKFPDTECVFGDHNEWKIFLTKEERKLDPLNRTCIFVDFKFKNKIIEFYGNYWHKNSTNADNFKESVLTNRGFKVLVVWEQDYKNNEDAMLDKCLKFLE